MLNSTWTGHAEAYDAVRNCWLNERRAGYILDQLRGFEPLRQVVEVGVGTGWLIRRLAPAFPEAQWLGVDPDENYVNYARSRAAASGTGGRAEFVVGYGETLEASVPRGVDLLLSNDVLHHLQDEQAAIGAAYAVLAPGGHWLAIEPNWLNPYVAVRQATRAGEKNFRPRTFVRMAKATGFRLVRREYLFLLPPSVQHPPRWLRAVEATLEKFPPLGGGVALLFQRPPDRPAQY